MPLFRSRTPSPRPVILALVALSTGCAVLGPDGRVFPEPRHYAAESEYPEMSHAAIFCPSGRAEYVLGGDVIERGTYRIRGRTVTIRGDAVVRYTLSEDEEVLRREGSDVELTRRHQFESESFCPDP